MLFIMHCLIANDLMIAHSFVSCCTPFNDLLDPLFRIENYFSMLLRFMVNLAVSVLRFKLSEHLFFLLIKGIYELNFIDGSDLLISKVFFFPSCIIFSMFLSLGYYSLLCHCIHFLFFQYY